jgi:DUF4097 and DUF4098 domain-containing protein YvlB
MIKQFSFLFLVAMLMSCANGDYDYQLEVTETRMWPTTGISQIAATAENGNITVSATTDDSITAEITKKCMGQDSLDAQEHIDDIVVSDYISGGQLNIDADMPDDENRSYAASFDINTLAATSLDLNTVNGTLSLADMIADAELTTTNGAVTVQNHQGSVDAQTTNGEIDCDLVLLDATESVVLLTVNGEAILSLPSDVSAKFDATTTNGTVTVSGFSAVNYTIDESNHKAGTIGAGDAIITITVTNGNITISAR